MSYSSEVLADSPIGYWRLGEPVVPAITAKTASSIFSSTFNADKAFDGDSTSAWTTNATTTGWVQIQYASAVTLTRYAVAGRRDASPTRSPKDWTLQGSNNGTTWTTLDTRTGVTDWVSQTDFRTYSFTNSTAYAYYRLNVTANNGDASYLNVTEFSMVPAVDESTGARAGVYTNSPTRGVAGALSGDSNTAVTFASASSQDMQVAYWSGLNITAFTLECWVKTTGTSQPIISRGGGTGASYGLWVDASGKAQVVIKTNSAGTLGTNYSGAVTINDGNWHHVVAARGTGTIVIYVDGVLDSSFAGTDTPFTGNAGGLVVGSRGGSPYLNGTIDEPAIYDAPVSGTRVAAHYSAGRGNTTVTLGLPAETDTALPIASGAGVVAALGLPVETDAALPVTVRVGFTVALGLPAETDTALHITPLLGEVVALGVAVETDAALPITATVGVVVTLGVAVETDTALPVTVGAGLMVALGVAVELDSALPVTISYGYATPNRRERTSGLVLTGTLPLEFDPVVDPAPARAAKRAVIAAAAFDAVSTTGTEASYAVVSKTKRRLRERVVIGGKDASYVFGAETQISWQLVSPLLYGPATATIPGIKTPFRQVGKGTLSWLNKGSTVRVDLVNDSDEVVERGVYKGFVTAWDINGTDLTVQIGGEASGRAALEYRPLPVYSTPRSSAGRRAYTLIRGLGLPFAPFLGPDVPNQSIPRVGGMFIIEVIEYLCRVTQRRDGTQYSIMPGASGAYRFEAKDRTTVHATVYVDGTRVKANLRSDIVDEYNRVYANAVTPAGQRLTGVVAPGIVQGTPAPWDGTNLSLGDEGGQVRVLIDRLRGFDLLDDVERGGFDEDVEEAVEDLQEQAGLPVTGVVNEATWNALFDLDVTGYALAMAHREPAAQQNRVMPFRLTPTGARIRKNPNYRAHLPKVDQVLDMGAGISARQRRRWARAELPAPSDVVWTGEVEVTTGAVIAGNHHFGDPLTSADLLDLRLVKPGQNIMLRGFQDDAGTLVHVSGVDVERKTLLVDTKARDTPHVWDAVRRRRDEDRWRKGRRASTELKDSVGEWDGGAGGKISVAVGVPAGMWTVFGVPAGDEGTISRFVLKTNPNAEFVAAFFGGSIVKEALENALNRKVGNPLTNEGYDKWDDHEVNEWLESKGVLGIWGMPEDPGGYNPRKKSNGGTLTGVLADKAGVAYRTERFPVLYVAVWSDRDTVIPAGKIMWNQLEVGA